MRILFVLPSVPFPPSDGGTTKIFNLLKYLATRHKCDLLCMGDMTDGVQNEFRSALPALGTVTVFPYPSRLRQMANLCWHLAHLRPPSFARFTCKRLGDKLADKVREGQYDVIHYDIINMAQYLGDGSRGATVHSPNDATSQVYARLATVSPSLFARMKLRFSSCLLRRFEREVYPRFCKIHVVSEEDKRYLVEVAPGSDIEVIPISSGYPNSLGTAERLPRQSGAGPVVAVCGNLGDAAITHGFEEFLEAVLPLLCQVYPTLRVRVLGRRIPDTLIRKLVSYPNVEYHAWVSDFEAFLTDADVVLTPDKAGAPGAKTRVVQAMALGVAVLGSATAFEGVPIQDGEQGFIYRSPRECGDKLLRLLGSASLRHAVGRAAAVLAAAEYALESIGPRYEALYLAAQNRANSQRSSPGSAGEAVKV